jgi:hypothetical protein
MGANISPARAQPLKERQMVAQSADHTREILYKAARGLAASSGTWTKRLGYAYTDGLIQFLNGTVPWPDLNDDLREIMDYFGPAPKPRRPRQVAEDIFDLFVKVSRRIDRGEQGSLPQRGRIRSRSHHPRPEGSQL